MTEPIVNRRRIDKLRAIAFEYGLTNEDAKDFGKLSKTATWEALLEVNRIVCLNGDAVDIAVNTVYTPLDNALDNRVEPLPYLSFWQSAMATNISATARPPKKQLKNHSRQRFQCRLD